MSKSTPVHYATIPTDLKAHAQWVCWKYMRRDGRWTKVPMNPHTGDRASVTKSHTWSSYDEALRVCQRGGYDGIGFVFTEDDPYTGIDLDHCRCPNTGALEPWAKKIVEGLQTYTEVSVSGTGVHCILRGHLQGDRSRSEQIEMYDSERFFTMTGICLPDTPPTIEARQTALEALYAETFPAQSSTTRPVTPPSFVPPHDLSDDEIIEKAHRAKNGDKFAELWAGLDDGYASRSEADAALCSALAFWTGPDPERIDRLFRESGLYRKKWDRPDYRDMTIEFVLKTKDAYYAPNWSWDVAQQEKKRFDALLTRFLKNVENDAHAPGADDGRC